jgi:hypothetical protein
MKRRIFKALAGVSLLLCVATAVLWSRSFTTMDSVEFTSPRGTYCAIQSTGGGWLRVVVTHNAPGPFGISINPRVPHARIWTFFPERGFLLNGVFTAGGTITHWFTPSGAIVSTTRGPYRAIAISDLHLAVLLLLSALICFVMYRRQRRGFPEGCPSCGYDLRATPDRCPECGMVLLKKEITN